MELWIRSQNKECLIKLDDYINYFYDDEENEHGIGSHMFTLGVYESKERALEVLDEIQNKINLINLGHDFGSPMVDLKNPTYIYQMPEK
jgi:hypothetical protein